MLIICTQFYFLRAQAQNTFTEADLKTIEELSTKIFREFKVELEKRDLGTDTLIQDQSSVLSQLKDLRDHIISLKRIANRQLIFDRKISGISSFSVSALLAYAYHDAFKLNNLSSISFNFC
jgi:hypothetical protein